MKFQAGSQTHKPGEEEPGWLGQGLLELSEGRVQAAASSAPSTQVSPSPHLQCSPGGGHRPQARKEW